MLSISRWKIHRVVSFDNVKGSGLMQSVCFRDGNWIVKHCWFVFFVLSAIVLLFASWCSFIYPLTFSIDTNIIMNAARRLLSGEMIYQDIFEHKGILVHFLYAAAWSVCHNSFHGIYLFEIMAATFYYLYTFKTLNVLSENNQKENILIAVIACTCCYLGYNMTQGGQIEEFALPLFAYLLYHVINYLYHDVMISKKTCFIIGIHAGLLFWAKYLCLAFYVVVLLYCIFFYCKKKQYRQIKHMFVFGSLGFLLVTVPVLSYFILTNTLSDMINIYFAENIFGYTMGSHSFISKLFSIIISPAICAAYSVFNCIYAFAILLIENHYRYSKDENRKWGNLVWLVVAVYVGVCAIVSVGGTVWPYYFIPTATLYSLILFLLLQMFPKFKKLLLVVFACPILAFSVWFTTYNHAYYGQYYQGMEKVVEIVQKSDNQDVIQFDYPDHGLYFMMNNLPKRYYFSLFGARKDEIQESYRAEIQKQNTGFVLLANSHDDELSEMEHFLLECGYELCYAPEALPKITPEIRLYKLYTGNQFQNGD